MKCVMRIGLSLLLLTGCQVATGLSELAVVEGEAGPDLPVAGRQPKGGSGGGEGGAGGKSDKGGDGGHAGMMEAPGPEPAVGGQGGTHSDGGKGGTGGVGGDSEPSPPPPPASGSGGTAGKPNAAGSGGAAGHDPKLICEHPGSTCDIVNSCGCESEMVCGIVKANDKLDIGCKRTAGRASIGNSCSGIDDCVPGSICIGGEDTSTCRKACNQDAECGADSACLRIKDFADLGFCAETCVSNSDCAATNCCIPSNEGVSFCTAAAACPGSRTTTTTTSPKAVGSACTTAGDCQSNNCHNGLCYDTHQDGTTCTRDIDCAGHACVSEFFAGTSKICSSARDACKQMGIDDCYTDLATAACQLTNKCSATKLSSFDACVRSSCVEAAKDYPLSQCQSAHDGFMTDRACPTPDTTP
jgi:hypothetical protein